MVSLRIMFHLSEAIFKIGTRKRKLAALSVTRTKSLLGLPKVRYYDLIYSLTLSLMICFYLQTNLKFANMPMKTVSTLPIKTLVKS